MSEHSARIQWTRESTDFKYDSYNREHTWTFENGTVVPASAAPAFKGSADHVDPEEAFVAAVSSCHMLTFLALCAKKRLVVDSYIDRAVGYLEKAEDGKLCMTRVELKPEVRFEGEQPGAEALQKIHHRAHVECFIARSVKTEISVL